MNEATPDDYDDNGKLKDPSHKVRPFIDLLNANFMNFYMPGFHCTCDEQSVPYTGCCCPYLQYNPAKPWPWAIRIYSLNCAKTNFCWKFEIFTGKGHKFPGLSPLEQKDQYTAQCLQYMCKDLPYEHEDGSCGQDHAEVPVHEGTGQGYGGEHTWP